MAPSTKERVMEDTEPVVHHYGYKKDFRTALPQLLAVSVKNLLLLGYGMTLGFQTILIPAVRNPVEGEVLHLGESEVSWISSLNLIIVPIGCALSGAVTTPMGRRRAMQMVNIPFAVAWIMFYFSKTTAHLYGALFLTGLAGGLLEAPVLTYVAEITQPHLRGALTATSSMCIIIGVFMQFLFGLFLYWRVVALVNIVFTVLAFIALCFVPESPHWLVSRKRVEDAGKSLQWLRGWTNPGAVEGELLDIQALYRTKKTESQDDKETLTEKLSLYCERSFIVPFLLVCYVFFVGHFSGMTTLQVYAVPIFQMLQAPLDKYYATLILGILQIVGSSICVILVHYAGKRPLTLFSTAGAAICCFLVAGYNVYIIQHGTLQEVKGVSAPLNSTTDDDSTVLYNTYSWIPTTVLLLLALITHVGIRLLPWILVGEVYSARTRSGAAGLSSAVGYIFNFLANKLFLNMVGNLSLWGTYGFYGLICASGTVVLYFALPETEGKKLNDIENHFAGIKKLSNEVYRSKCHQKTKLITFGEQSNYCTFSEDSTVYPKRRLNEDSKLHELKGTVNPSFDVNSSNL